MFEFIRLFLVIFVSMVLGGISCIFLVELYRIRRVKARYKFHDFSTFVEIQEEILKRIRSDLSFNLYTDYDKEIMSVLLAGIYLEERGNLESTQT